jgi:signal transduction histidine kinase
LSIEDSGIGMSPAEMKHLQRNSFCAETGSNNKNSCGLGFVLSRKYIESLGGKLELKSEIEKGSKVFIFIPNKLAAKQAE